jgi:GNAT superfamily N-acetyltransferase
LTGQDVIIRSIHPSELDQLLELYRHLNPHDAPLPPRPEVDALWHEIMADPKLHYVVAEADGHLVATCTLTVVPNLTRGTRPYGLVENVVTHADYRRRGLGTAVLRRAFEIAWDAGCYKVMLLTSAKDPGVLPFYEQAGFQRDVKTGFVVYSPRIADIIP